MQKIIAAAGATLALAATAANATGTPFTGLLFAAWNDDVSYSVDLGVDLGSFDADVNQTFALPDIAAAFGGDLSGVSFSVIGADNTDVFVGGATMIATGDVGPLLQDGANDGNELVVFANSANNFRETNNGACADASPCTAVFGDPNYAGNPNYGANLGGGPASLNVAGSLLNDQLAVNLLEGALFDFDNITVTSLAGFFAFDGQDLQYVIPVPAAGWLMLSGIFGLFGLRRRA
jgi:hypothetical protein